MRNGSKRRNPNLQLTALPGRLAICRLDANSLLPDWVRGEFVAITRTSDELSIVCLQEAVPADVQCQRGWRAIKVLGPLDFSLTGVLSSLAQPLAEAQIPIFAISTYDTDYLLIEEDRLEEALHHLRQAGHRIAGS